MAKLLLVGTAWTLVLLSIENRAWLAGSRSTRMSWWNSGSRLSLLIRRSSPLPAQLVQVDGLAPSAVSQMAMNSLLDGMPVDMGSVARSDETNITRALTGFVAEPLVVCV